jgi:hypothetical protein
MMTPPLLLLPPELLPLPPPDPEPLLLLDPEPPLLPDPDPPPLLLDPDPPLLPPLLLAVPELMPPDDALPVEDPELPGLGVVFELHANALAASNVSGRSAVRTRQFIKYRADPKAPD